MMGIIWCLSALSDNSCPPHEFKRRWFPDKRCPMFNTPHGCKTHSGPHFTLVWCHQGTWALRSSVTTHGWLAGNQLLIVFISRHKLVHFYEKRLQFEAFWKITWGKIFPLFFPHEVLKLQQAVLISAVIHTWSTKVRYDIIIGLQSASS